jgi:predicted dehydrogenase
MTIRLVQIGLGEMGRRHADTWKEMPGVHVSAVCDADSSMKDLAAKYAPKFYTDLGEAIKNEKPDAVDLVVPAGDHYRLLNDLVNLGVKHVLDEKPAVPIEQLELGRQIAKSASDAGTAIMVGDIMAYDPAVRALKQNLDKLGKLEYIMCEWRNPHLWKIDVGVNNDLLPHGAIVAEVLTNWAKYYTTNWEAKALYSNSNRVDFAMIDAKTVTSPEVGFLGTAAWMPRGMERMRRATIIGDKAIAEVDFLPERRSIKIVPAETTYKIRYGSATERSKLDKGMDMEALQIPDEEPLTTELEHFRDSTEYNRTVITSLERSLQTLEMLVQTTF